MKMFALALIAAIGLGAAPVLANEADSGSVGQFVQWQRAPLPAHPVQTAQVAHR
jgi:hypothetical protein